MRVSHDDVPEGWVMAARLLPPTEGGISDGGTSQPRQEGLVPSKYVEEEEGEMDPVEVEARLRQAAQKADEATARAEAERAEVQRLEEARAKCAALAAAEKAAEEYRQAREEADRVLRRVEF